MNPFGWYACSKSPQTYYNPGDVITWYKWCTLYSCQSTGAWAPVPGGGTGSCP
jgi:hypothetical protein